MTHLIVSTNHREVSYSDVSGWLYTIDLDTRNILQKTTGIEAPYRKYDTNPRGGMRGMRGISYRGGEMAIANYSSVFFFDRHWNLIRVFTHPSVSAIHEILYVENGIWVTSTANDLLAKFDISGGLSEYYLVREQKKLVEQLKGPTRQVLRSKDIGLDKKDFRRRSYFNSDIYDRVHLNGIAQTNDGHLLLSMGLIIGTYFSVLVTMKKIMLNLNLWDYFLKMNSMFREFFGLKKLLHSDLVVQPAKGRSAIVQFNSQKTWFPILELSVAHNPSHSVRVLRDGTGVYLDTSRGAIVHFERNGEIYSNTKITDRFLRGVLELPSGQLVIGAGNTLLIFDLTARKIVDQIELSKEPLNTVFDIQILPPEFELPPSSLGAKTGRMAGFDGQKIIWEQGNRYVA